MQLVDTKLASGLPAANRLNQKQAIWHYDSRDLEISQLLLAEMS